MLRSKVLMEYSSCKVICSGLDLGYCHKNYQRCGIGKQIYWAIEAKAVELSVSRLFTEASITAKPFFQRMGFSIVKEQEVTCRGETLINYAMEKLLRKVA